MRTHAKGRFMEINPMMLQAPDQLPISQVPADWQVKGPDYVGIGTPKSGTTWWHQLILEHPAVIPNRFSQKELHFFCHYGLLGMTEKVKECYLKAFSRPDEKRCGEWSPGYLSYPMALEMLAEVAPHAKLILLVRNPVERLMSHLNQLQKVRTKFLTSRHEAQYVFFVFSAFPEVVSASLLGQPTRRLVSLFPRSQILVLQYEKCVLEPGVELQRTYRFLSLDPTFVPPSLNRRINVLSREKPRILREQCNRLADYLREDANLFFDLFPEVDASLWPEFISR
jgi:hypothetical protein